MKKAVGIGLIGLFFIGIALNSKDIARYIKISMM